MLTALLNPDKSKSTYLVKTSPVPTKALELASSNHFDKNKTYFILLPGNSGNLDTGTNHNLGYDTFEHLIKKFNLRGSDKKNFESIENVLIRDGDEFWEEQLFRSQKDIYRTAEGQMFYRHFQKSGKTIVLLRSNTNYNEGSSYFFLPVIEQMGGLTKNIIVVHDDLKSAKGSVKTLVRQEIQPDGNNALKNLQFNLYASRILSYLDQNLEKHNLLFGESNTSLLRDLRLTLTDSRFDKKSTSGKVLKLIKKKISQLIVNRTKVVKSNIGQPLNELGKTRGMWAKEKNPEIKLELRKVLEKIEESLNSQFSIEMKELDKLESFNQKLNTKLKSFEQELKDYTETIPIFETYSEIRLGTGYDEWSQDDIRSAANPYGHEIGSFAHFVLSPYDKSYFNAQYFNNLVQNIDELIFSLE